MQACPWGEHGICPTRAPQHPSDTSVPELAAAGHEEEEQVLPATAQSKVQSKRGPLAVLLWGWAGANRLCRTGWEGGCVEGEAGLGDASEEATGTLDIPCEGLGAVVTESQSRRRRCGSPIVRAWKCRTKELLC